MTTYSVWALYIQHPADNVAAGDLHSIKVVAANAEDAKQWAWRHAIRSHNRNEGIWLHGHDSILIVSEFDAEPVDTTPGLIVESSIWAVDCKYCELPIEKESRTLWVSAETGGTYDHCTVNTGDPNEYPNSGHRPQAGHSVDQAEYVRSL